MISEKLCRNILKSISLFNVLGNRANIVWAKGGVARSTTVPRQAKRLLFDRGHVEKPVTPCHQFCWSNKQLFVWVWVASCLE